MSSSLRKQVMARGVGSSGLPPIPDIPGSAPSRKLPRVGRLGSSRDYSPLDWNAFFDDKKKFTIGDSCFTAYLKGTTGPLFVMLHGGGYSGLTWACFAKEITEILNCSVLAPDLRGHGDTTTKDDEDLSIKTQANDVRMIIDAYMESLPDDQSLPGLIIVGHSMGGAVAVHAAALLDPALVLGLVVIDVVEGSAMDALFSMRSFLMSRPSSFKSVEQGVEWCLRSGQTRNPTAARVSFPGQIRRVGSKAPEGDSDSSAGDQKAAQDDESESFVWRIDLMKTEPHWKGWFEGLSSKFLSVPAPKTLILAGVDRLDKDLTVGQMQGKFQMIVLPKVGHAVHEDSPKKVAEAMATFCVRHQLTTAKQEFSMVFPGC